MFIILFFLGCFSDHGIAHEIIKEVPVYITDTAYVEVEVEVEEEDEEEEEKEELSAQRSEIDKLKEALEETNARIEQLQKLSAHSGLKHKAPSFKKAEPLDLSNMTIEERVRALANQFNS